MYLKKFWVLDKGITNWGVGSYGNFGNSIYLDFKVPTENQHMNEFLKQSHLKIVKAKTSGWSTVVQLSNTNKNKTYNFER